MSAKKRVLVLSLMFLVLAATVGCGVAGVADQAIGTTVELSILPPTSTPVLPTPTRVPATLEGHKVLILQQGVFNPNCNTRGRVISVKADGWECTDKAHAMTPDKGNGIIAKDTELGIFETNSYYHICLESDSGRCGWYEAGWFQILN